MKEVECLNCSNRIKKTQGYFSTLIEWCSRARRPITDLGECPLKKKDIKSIIKYNIQNAKNFLMETSSLPMGMKTHDIISNRAKLEYCLKKFRISKVKSLNDDNFKEILRYVILIKSFYFDIMKTKGR